ncbi:uncharacterized protein LOC8265007 [Ricinus communis]|uniref:uncharacterized protein LOC8265007 n=1 Tax=Ricinus communis TaxID=3988 RepID=UPI00201B30F6|nr:uncharacterized protein LOC8265007 [Ricinus communis]
MGWHSKEKENLESALGESTLLILQLGKQYNLRMLLNVIKGAVNDKEWNDCLSEAVAWATGDQLGKLFATILVDCEVAEPFEVWRTNMDILAEEMSHDITPMGQLHEQLHEGLNVDQKNIHESITDSVKSTRGKLFFVHGHGDAYGESSCDINRGSQLVEVLLQTSLIIWDEAPMANESSFEALDKSLRDIMQDKYDDSMDRPFEGIIMVLGEDFRQILPVVPKGSRNDIVQASITSSYLWNHFEVLVLKKNMRLSRNSEEDDLVPVPPDIMLNENGDPIRTIVEATYPSLRSNIANISYTKERAILTTKNDTVHDINNVAMNLIEGDEMTYFSSDSICKSSTHVNDRGQSLSN